MRTIKPGDYFFNKKNKRMIQVIKYYSFFTPEDVFKEYMQYIFIDTMTKSKSLLSNFNKDFEFIESKDVKIQIKPDGYLQGIMEKIEKEEMGQKEVDKKYNEVKKNKCFRLALIDNETGKEEVVIADFIVGISNTKGRNDKRIYDDTQSNWLTLSLSHYVVATFEQVKGG